MGKKKNKNKNYSNQDALLDAFDGEKFVVPMSDLFMDKETKIENDIISDINSVMNFNSNSNKSDDIEKEEVPNITDSIPIIFDADETEKERTEKVFIDKSREVSIVCNWDLFKVNVLDGIAPFTINTKRADSSDIINIYDVSDAADKITAMTDYLISMKYPYAIFDAEELLNDDKVKSVCEANFDKFRFYSYGDYVFCYIVDDDSFDKFNDDMDSFDFDTDDFLRYYVSLCYEVNNPNVAFNAESKYDVTDFTNSDMNLCDSFIDAFVNDSKTIIDENDEDAGIEDQIISIESIHTIVRAMISSMTGEYTKSPLDEEEDEEFDLSFDENDDTDDDDTEETSDDVKTNEEETNENDDISDLIDDDMEMIDEESEDIKVITAGGDKSNIVKVMK